MMTNAALTHGNSGVWDDFTHGVIGCAIKVHRILGCVLLESAYEECLTYELIKSGFSVARQVVLPIEYDGVRINAGYKPDLVIDGKLIVELKTVPTLLPIHDAQLLTYLRLTGIEVGLLMNFHAHPLMRGIKRLMLTRRQSN
jgi:GxxExxY protein